MLNALPAVQITGEHGGQLTNWREIWGKIQATNRQRIMSYAHESITQNMFYCHVQDWYWEHSDPTCMKSGATVHGFKEIRYNTPEDIEWLKEVFPCAKFIFNYRDNVSHYSTFKTRSASPEELQKEADLLKWYATGENPWKSQAFDMPLEALNSTAKWNSLLEWIDHPECKHQFTLHSNKKKVNMRGHAQRANSDNRSGAMLCNGEPMPPQHA
mmetsp:Transcript_24950/g.78117  ORF Transcript_24950/g.78117 Transcript_24950/m.78117 type:complete len:213 (-) Transcript_24950:812-1450(-)